MTAKKEEKKATPKSKKPAVKEVLYKLVESSDVPEPLLMGILVRAGLYRQYLAEMEQSESEVVPATITRTEFNNIINKYKGA